MVEASLRPAFASPHQGLRDPFLTASRPLRPSPLGHARSGRAIVIHIMWICVQYALPTRTTSPATTSSHDPQVTISECSTGRGGLRYRRRPDVTCLPRSPANRPSLCGCGGNLWEIITGSVVPGSLGRASSGRRSPGPARPGSCCAARSTPTRCNAWAATSTVWPRHRSWGPFVDRAPVHLTPGGGRRSRPGRRGGRRADHDHRGRTGRAAPPEWRHHPRHSRPGRLLPGPDGSGHRFEAPRKTPPGPSGPAARPAPEPMRAGAPSDAAVLSSFLVQGVDPGVEKAVTWNCATAGHRDGSRASGRWRSEEASSATRSRRERRAHRWFRSVRRPDCVRRPR
jgi:hypothetical protein